RKSPSMISTGRLARLRRSPPLRAITRTGSPRSRSCRATAEPMNPVAPVTRTVMVAAPYGKRAPMKKVIFTAHDLRLTPEGNGAGAEAHRSGVPTAASLMIAAPAAEEAVAIARMLPTLGVGLHVVEADAKPILPPEQIPALVNSAGRLPSDLVGVGVRCF